jgi:hypothetical protein
MLLSALALVVEMAWPFWEGLERRVPDGRVSHYYSFVLLVWQNHRVSNLKDEWAAAK